MFLNNRQHPIKILSYTTRSFWLLLIPLTRSLVALRFDVATWLEGWWLDVVVISVIFFYAFFRWLFVTFDLDDDEIVANTGLLGIVKTTLPYNKICSVSFSQGVLQRLFRAYVVYIDTDSGTHYKSDLVLTMKKSQVQRLGILTGDISCKPSFSYSPQIRNLVIFSLLFSQTLSGVLLFLTLIIQSSRIFDRRLEQQFFTTLHFYAEFLSVNLPRHIIVFGMIILIGWIYSFFLNIMRHWSFSVSRVGSKLVISSGIIAKRFHRLCVEKIKFIDIQQSLLMKIFNICSVHIHCAGYGKSRREIAVLIPITTLSEVQKSVNLLLSESLSPRITLKSRKRNAMRFLWPPVWVCVLIPVCTAALTSLFSEWWEIIRFIGVIFEIPSLWLLAVKTASVFTTGIGIEKGYAKISYCRFYKFHTLIISVDRISKLSLYQTPFQRLSKNISFRIFSAGERLKARKVKNFPQKEAEHFCRKHGLLPENL